MWIKLVVISCVAVCLFPDTVHSEVDYPAHCSTYMVLDEWDRNVKNGGCGRNYGKECFCDNAVQTNRPKSLNWKEPGYYRFLDPAGSQMPEGSTILDNRCGSDAGGWLVGKHPQEYGLETNMTVCFDGRLGGTCNYKANITVTRCSNFYVYHLSTPPCYMSNPPNCALRYCATRAGAAKSQVLTLEEELETLEEELETLEEELETQDKGLETLEKEFETLEKEFETLEEELETQDKESEKLKEELETQEEELETLQEELDECKADLQLPKQCRDYKSLNEKDRSTSSPIGVGSLSDRLGAGKNKSPSWEGENWYRVEGQAGTRIPENPPEYSSCATLYTGWMDDKHPTILGQTKEVTFLFSNGQWLAKYGWVYDVQGRVTNCGKDKDGKDIYVYYLREPEDFNFRYCSEP